MSKSEKEKFIEFCGVLGFKVNDTQIKVFELYNQAKQENKEMFINLGRQQGRQYLNTILINFELWEKDHRIAELEKENFELQIELGITKSNLDLEVEAKQRLLEIKEELEQKLENAIMPKFRVGDEVWVNATQMNFKIEPEQQTINGIDYYYKLKTRPYWNALEFELFATEQEARDRLEELKNGKAYVFKHHIIKSFI